jgi:hypothetical protein
VYFWRVETSAPPDPAYPSAKIPTVLFPVAEPLYAAPAAVPAATTHPEYVYLLRAVGVQYPKLNMPLVLFPAAVPKNEPAVAAPAEATEQLEYVYLLRVVEKADPLNPS